MRQVKPTPEKDEALSEVTNAFENYLRRFQERTEEDKTIQPQVVIPWISINHAPKVLDCSRTFLYDLIDEGILTVFYLKSKPYLMIDEILKAMKPKEKRN